MSLDIMNLFDLINTNIQGRLALANNAECELLYKYAQTPGNHLELGTLWGGSAIVAGLAKIKYDNSHKVYTVDFMQGGYWNSGDPGCNLKIPTMKTILDNIEMFKLNCFVTSIKESTNPIPVNIKPTTVLIDAGHSFEDCLKDWNNVKELKPKFVLFHDYNTGKHPGVQRVVDEVVKLDNGWKEVEAVNTMIVFERIA